jgi:hypothetical protein
MRVNFLCRFADIKDGTSNTWFGLEVRSKVPGPSQGQSAGVFGMAWGTPAYVTWFLNYPIGLIGYEDCCYANSNSPWFVGAVTSPQFGLNAIIPDSPITGWNGVWPTFRTAGSFHPGGANALNADGSVLFISQNIDFVVLRARCSLNQGEVLDSTGKQLF